MKRLVICMLVLLATQCRERYDVPLTTPPNGLLVVEGIINSAGETTIRLSKTSKLSERRFIPEKNASVQIVGENNSVNPLVEKEEGIYSTDMLTLNNAVRYKLAIKTSENKEYASEFTSVKATPPIDSLSWIYNNEGVTVYVNSHDAQNSTHYYKWDYIETWEFHSAFTANLTFTTNPGTTPVVASLDYIYPNHLLDTTIYVCWQSATSSKINTVSTTKWASDVVYVPVVTHPTGSEELSQLYSIKVRQIGLSKEAFDFFEKMKKNSESLGSLFDAQPSEIKGNITCISNPSEQVIGFVEVSSGTEKRLFIDNKQLPDWNYDQHCGPSLRPVANNRDSVQEAYSMGLLPTVPHTISPFGNIINFNAAPGQCVDCTLKGTNQKPIFWP